MPPEGLREIAPDLWVILATFLTVAGPIGGLVVWVRRERQTLQQQQSEAAQAAAEGAQKWWRMSQELQTQLFEAGTRLHHAERRVLELEAIVTRQGQELSALEAELARLRGAQTSEAGEAPPPPPFPFPYRRP